MLEGLFKTIMKFGKDVPSIRGDSEVEASVVGIPGFELRAEKYPEPHFKIDDNGDPKLEIGSIDVDVLSGGFSIGINQESGK